MNERNIFLSAIDLPASERQAYLEQACANQPELRARVEDLLLAHEKSGSFLNAPADPNRTLDTPDTDKPSDKSDLTFLQPGTKPGSMGRLAHYEILEVLGRGGFGIVFKAFDEKLHRVVAIKAMAPHLATTSPPRKRFLREARAVAAIGHENVVAVYAVEEQPIPYIVMEFVSGSTLQQHIDKTGPLELPEILRFSKQIALGLEAAHGTGMIHRDIKPGNILLEAGPEPKVKITDFGLARAADDASLTQSGTIVGTPMYMSPEQAMGKPVDPRSDLFSLGSVMYVMASGRPPFRADSTLAVLKRVTEDTPRPIREIVETIPEWLCSVIEKLHAKNPADRFTSAKEVAEAVDQAVAVDLPRPARKAPAKTKSSTAIILMILLGVFVVGCGAAVLIPVLGWFFYADGRAKANPNRPEPELTKLDKPETLEGEEFLPFPMGNTPSEKVVYYKSPFASPPYLTFPAGIPYGYTVSDEKAGSFKITRAIPKEDVPPEIESKPGVEIPLQVGREPRWPIFAQTKLKWKAEGRPQGTEKPLSNDDPGLFVPVFDPDRKVAQWVVSANGIVYVEANGKVSKIQRSPELPKGDFEIRDINFDRPDARELTLDDIDQLRNLSKTKLGFQLHLCGQPVMESWIERLSKYPCKDSLTYLDLGKSSVEDRTLNNLSQFPKLQILKLRDTNVSGAGLKSLQTIALTELDLRSCKRIDNDALDSLLGLSQLKILLIGGTNATAEGVMKLRAAFPNCKIVSDFDVALDLDRKAAEWVLSVGGSVRIHCDDDYTVVKKSSELPKRNFHVIDVLLDRPASRSITIEELENLRGISEPVNRLHLDGQPVTSAWLEALAAMPGISSMTRLDLGNTPLQDNDLLILKKFPKLKELALQSTKITGSGLKNLKPLSLEVLDLNACKQIKTDDFIHLADHSSLKWIRVDHSKFGDTDLSGLKNLRQLQSLHIGNTQVSEAGLDSVSQFTNLQELTLSHLSFSDKGFAKLEHLKKITGLQLQNTSLTRESLSVILGFKDLRFLDLQDSKSLNDDDLARLAILPKLEGLTISGTGATDAGIKKLRAAMPNCKIVSDFDLATDHDRKAAEWVLLIGGTISFDGGAERIADVAALPKSKFQLTAVHLGDNKKVDDRAIVIFAGCEKLEILDLALTGITDAGLIHLRSIKTLKAVLLYSTRVSNAGMEHLAGNLGLETLEVHATQVTDTGLARFKDCKNLHSVDLRSLRITNEGLRPFAGCKLRELKLGDTPTTDDGLAILKATDDLRNLDLTNTKITDRGLKHLAGNKRIAALGLSNTPITDDGLAQLALTELVDFSAQGSAITDRTLTALAKLPILRHIDVRMTKVSKQGILEFRAAKPNCTIVWDDGTIEPKK